MKLLGCEIPVTRRLPLVIFSASADLLVLRRDLWMQLFAAARGHVHSCALSGVVCHCTHESQKRDRFLIEVRGVLLGERGRFMQSLSASSRWVLVAVAQAHRLHAGMVRHGHSMTISWGGNFHLVSCGASMGRSMVLALQKADAHC